MVKHVSIFACLFSSLFIYLLCDTFCHVAQRAVSLFVALYKRGVFIRHVTSAVVFV